MRQILLMFVSMLILITGCAEKPVIIPESKVDTSEYHYLQGITALDNEDYLSAKSSFNRSVGINPDFGDGYAGLALVFAEMGQSSKSGEFLKKAFDTSEKTARMYLIKGRVLTRLKSEKKWLKKAQKSFDKAEESGANISETTYYRAEAYREAGDYELAAGSYKKVIDQKGKFTEDANEKYKKMQILVRVSPGTTVGESIVMMTKITRAELAALLCTEFKIKEVFQRFGVHHYDLTYSPYDEEVFILSEDAEKNWASNWISIVLELGVMESYPDGNFKPDKTLQRYEYAMAIQAILINLQKDLSLAGKYIGEESRFPDVSSTHFAYNAMALAAERGIITPEKINGVYNPKGPVSGVKALEIIREFQNKLSIHF